MASPMYRSAFHAGITTANDLCPTVLSLSCVSRAPGARRPHDCNLPRGTGHRTRDDDRPLLPRHGSGGRTTSTRRLSAGTARTHDAARRCGILGRGQPTVAVVDDSEVEVTQGEVPEGLGPEIFRDHLQQVAARDPEGGGEITLQEQQVILAD